MIFLQHILDHHDDMWKWNCKVLADVILHLKVFCAGSCDLAGTGWPVAGRWTPAQTRYLLGFVSEDESLTSHAQILDQDFSIPDPVPYLRIYKEFKVFLTPKFFTKLSEKIIRDPDFSHRGSCGKNITGCRIGIRYGLEAFLACTRKK